MIAPNKQNLIQLNNQKKATLNGYKLLKEKRAGLIKYFLGLSKEGKKYELNNQNNYDFAFSTAKLFSIYDIDDLNSYLLKSSESSICVLKKRVSGVYITTIEVETNIILQNRLKEITQNKLIHFSEIFPNIIKLTQLKLNCKLIAEEISKTNRQILNLEKKIEDINTTTKKIKSILSDKENLEKSILVKLFI